MPDTDTKTIYIEKTTKGQKKQNKTKRKAPNVSPKNHEVGEELLSENDKNMYEIVVNKLGNKRWKKMKKGEIKIS